LDRHIRKLLTGSGFLTICQFGAAALGFVITVLISRVYGPSVLGVTASISSAVTLMSFIALLGTDTLSLKVFSRSLTRREFYDLYRKILVVCCFGIALVLSVSLFLSIVFKIELLGGLRGYTFLLLFLIIVAVFQKLNFNVLRGQGEIFYFSTAEIVSTATLFVSVGMAIVLGARGEQIPYWYSMSYVSGFLYSIYALWKIESKGKRIVQRDHLHDDFTYYRIIRSSVPMLGTTLSFTVITTTDILILNIFMEQDRVGVYSVYVRLLLGITIIVNSVNSVLAPQIARFFEKGEVDVLEKFIKKTTLITLFASLIPATLLVVFDDYILGIFGNEFISDRVVLYILISSCLLNVFFGETGFFLNMTRNENIFFIIMSVSACINLLLNIVLIRIYGTIGAAIASLVTVFVWNVMSTIVIYRRFGHTLFFWSYR
jgi:O-antigen/teichoic acid export membrane protein